MLIDLMDDAEYELWEVKNVSLCSTVWWSLNETDDAAQLTYKNHKIKMFYKTSHK